MNNRALLDAVLADPEADSPRLISPDLLTGRSLATWMTRSPTW